MLIDFSLTLTPDPSQSVSLVSDLYAALTRRKASIIKKLLGNDLETWFHGPPSCQFLTRILSGDSTADFIFVPYSITAVGPIVLAEGYDECRSITWVHAWTVTRGMITLVREYLNTSLTVTRLDVKDTDSISSGSSSSGSVSSLHCPLVWESRLPNQFGKSVPGIVLAI